MPQNYSYRVLYLCKNTLYNTKDNLPKNKLGNTIYKQTLQQSSNCNQISLKLYEYFEKQFALVCKRFIIWYEKV